MKGGSHGNDDPNGRADGNGWHPRQAGAAGYGRQRAVSRGVEALPEGKDVSLREAIGHVLRDLRTRDNKTLREVSEKAGVSLGYLSEVERGQKEASSELLSSIAGSLGVSTAQMLRLVADYLDSIGE